MAGISQILVGIFVLFGGLFGLTQSANAASWTVETHEGIAYPTFSYEPVYADYDCVSKELYISLPEDLNIQFNGDIEVRFGTNIVSLKVTDAYSEDGNQDLVLTGENMVFHMVEENYYLLLPDNRAGVGIPLKGFQEAFTKACR